MSEIKGQILGVVLVLSIFGAIGTVLVTAFKTNAENIAKQITEESKISPETTTEQTNQNKFMIENDKLLKF